ncbi:MAG: DUF1287 domain-containing protein [Agathobacter sp.]|nr:DUF1287 domain-containing protein [Agathobacter sp.]
MGERIRKSQEERKRQIVRRCLVVGILVVVILVGVLYQFNVIPHNYYYNSHFGITTYKSDVDYDEDGIDDQTDILEGVRAYIATNPKYKSVYYAGGYPTDEYGVCTDVVAQGFLNAGYDLRELVSADIEAAPEAYNIANPDKNIDFRRVRNLRVFFERHAISLTTDVAKVEEWQGGDIIIFEDDHIGIISDKRNGNGTVFIIHHGSPMQAGYEQDILEGRDDIVGHYRWN